MPPKRLRLRPYMIAKVGLSPRRAPSGNSTLTPEVHRNFLARNGGTCHGPPNDALSGFQPVPRYILEIVRPASEKIIRELRQKRKEEARAATQKPFPKAEPKPEIEAEAGNYVIMETDEEEEEVTEVTPEKETEAESEEDEEEVPAAMKLKASAGARAKKQMATSSKMESLAVKMVK